MKAPSRCARSRRAGASAPSGGRARRSSVDLSKDDVHRADHRDRVGDHVAARHLVERPPGAGSRARGIFSRYGLLAPSLTM
jgi:hypothetical protein